jgi:hypothetical protein
MTTPTPPVPASLALLSRGAQFFSRIGFSKQVVRLVANRMYSDESGRETFEDYDPTAHDLFAVTHARSGTNWVLQIAQQIAYLGEGEYDHIHGVVPWPEIPAPELVPLNDMSARDASPTGKRVIKTHLQSQYVPYNEDSAYVSVIRDPKDVIASHYYFGLGPAKISHRVSVADFLDIYLDPNCRGGCWAEHTAGYWAWKDRPNVEVFLFAEMKKDLKRTVEKIAQLMKVRLTRVQLAKVMGRSSFEYMKKRESLFAPPVPPFMTAADNADIIRTGKIGGSDSLFTRAQQARIDRVCQEELQRYGSEFPYSKYFDVVSDK